MKTLQVLLSVVVLGVGCSLHRNASANHRTITAAERAEAIALIRHDTGRGPYIRQPEIAEVVRAVRLVRAAFPEGHDVVADPSHDLAIRLTDSAGTIMASHLPDR
jgi:hypothetical protein